MTAEIKFVAGSIFSEEAYARGKMLDHSGWSGELVRKITPSDVDMYVDNDGSILFAELSSSACSWDQEQEGQRRGFENHIKDKLHCAVLCKHNVDATHKINTYTDVESFQVMIWHHGPVLSRIVDGVERWQSLVRTWCNRVDGPLLIHRQIIAAQIKRPQNVVPIRRTNAES